MKKVLIITYSYPPYLYGQRAASLRYYLSELGYSVKVIAVRGKKLNDQPELDECEYVGFKTKVNKTSLLQRFKNIPHIDKSWGGHNYEILRDKVFNEFDKLQPEIIIATSCNVLFIHTVAMELAKKTKTPWIADVRDIDEQFPLDHKLFNKAHINYLRYRLRRNKILKKADFITTVSKWHKSFLVKTLNKKEVGLIYNGFDPRFFKIKNKQITEQDKFVLANFGRIFSWQKEGLLILLKTIKAINDSKKIKRKVIFSFTGIYEDNLKYILDEYTDIIELNKPVEFSKVNQKLKDSSALVVFTNSKNKGVMSTKLFEYLTACKPIICLPKDDGSITNVLKDLNIGDSFSDSNKLKAFLENIINDTDSINSYVSDKKYITKIEKFSRKNQTVEFAKIIENVLGK